MTKNTTRKTDEKPEEEAMATGNVETIRDILFGKHIQDYEKRFKLLEQRLASDISALAKSSTRDLENIHKEINSSLDSHATQMAAETAARSAALDALEAATKADSGDLGKQLDQVESDAGKALAQTREELLEKLDDTRKLLETRLDELTKQLAEQIDFLTDDKISRSQMSSLLSQVASQLDPDKK